MFRGFLVLLLPVFLFSCASSLVPGFEKEKDIFRAWDAYKIGGGQREFQGWFKDVWFPSAQGLDEPMDIEDWRTYAGSKEPMDIEDWLYQPGVNEPMDISPKSSTRRFRFTLISFSVLSLILSPFCLM